MYMKKMKILAIMVVSLLVGLSTISVSGANKLDGQIDVEITQFIGLVHPHINLDNDSDISFAAESVEQDNVSFFRVNDSITIDLEITDNTGKGSYLFARTFFYSAIILRQPVINMKVGSFLKRMIPAIELLKPVKVVNSTLGGNRTTEIEIPVNYIIAKETLEPEEMKLILVVFGMPPGDINGIEVFPLIDYKIVKLNVDYISIL